VADGRIVVFHRVGTAERAQAHDAEKGTLLWQTDFPASYRGGINPDTGPRCVPLIHKDRVFLYGAAGDLHCVDVTNGQQLWSRNPLREFAGQEGYFGAGSTPIVAEGKLLLNVGGRKVGIVAFDIEQGAIAWQATEERASYSSPTLAQIDGRPQVIFVTRLHALSLDPGTGEVGFRFPFGQRGPTVNAATPLVVGDHLFVSASYGVGARWSRIEKGQAQVVWENDDTMSSQYSTCVFHDGFFYGTHGREDLGSVELRCFEAQSGKVLWRESDFAVAHSILVQDRLLVLTVEGTLILAEASPDAFRPLARAQVSPRITRSLPALSNGRFYFRDHERRGGTLHCLQLATQP
jgi:outer membrane protein assembly factor BamB